MKRQVGLEVFMNGVVPYQRAKSQWKIGYFHGPLVISITANNRLRELEFADSLVFVPL
jgi:hypothetical protein